MILRQAFSRASDVYAFGLILWELITWEVPFKEMSQFQVRRGPCKPVCRVPAHTVCSHLLGYTLLAMLTTYVFTRQR